MNVIRRHSRRRTHRKPVLFQLSGLWHPCDEAGRPIEGGESIELGIVRGLLQRAPFGSSSDMVNVTEGDNTGFWLPV